MDVTPINMKQKLWNLLNAVNALYSTLENGGLIEGNTIESKVLLFQTLRVQRELAKAIGDEKGEAECSRLMVKTSEIATPSPRNDWKEYYVVADANVEDDDLDSDDHEVAGVYSITVDPQCLSPATALLDAFHCNVAVSCLDDFSFYVVDPELGQYVDEVDGVDSYTMEGQAEFYGSAMDELPDDLQAALARNE